MFWPHPFGIGLAVIVTAYLGWRYMMARGLPYSPEEDAILLSTSSTADIQAKLRAGGYPERSDNAVKQRRGELRRNGGVLGSRFRTAPPKSDVVLAATEFETAKADVARLRQQLAEAEAQVVAARKRLGTALATDD